jgi:uncharacterized protein
MVIDFHAHVFEDRKASDITRDVCRRARIPCFSDGSFAGLMTSMDRGGIDVSVVSRITTTPRAVGKVNDWLRTLGGPRIRPLATIAPAEPGAADEVAGLREQGFAGIKLHPDYQGFFVDEKRLFPFYEAVEAAGLPLLLHAGLDRGLPGVPLHASPEALLAVHEQFPRLRLVAAHMGGEEIYDRTEACLLGKDVYLDTSFVLRKMPSDALERFASKHPAERILFGSDSPWVDQGEDLRFLLSLPFLRSEQKEKITFRNAAELLGFSKKELGASGRPMKQGQDAPSRAEGV